MKDLIQQLYQFIQDADAKRLPTNKWLVDEKMSIYVRRSSRLLPEGDELQAVLDIASIQVVEQFQNQGLFSRFLEKAHAMNPWSATYIENVLNPFLSASLEKHGWNVSGKHPPLSYYKLTDKVANYETSTQ